MSIPPETRFHKNVLGFAALLIELNDNCHRLGFPVIDTGILRLAEVGLSKLPDSKVINSFCIHSRPLWDKILNREEEFLKQNLGTVFENLPVDLSPQIVKLLEATDNRGRKIVTEEDVEGIWLYLEALVKIAIKWLYQQAGNSTDEQGADQIRREAKKWGLSL